MKRKVTQAVQYAGMDSSCGQPDSQQDWLSSIPGAPTFHPTAEEWADPLAYLSRIHDAVVDSGIAVIHSPLPARDDARDVLRETGLKFTTRIQTLGLARWDRWDSVRYAESGQTYTIDDFIDHAWETAVEWLRKTQPPPPVNEIERMYWETQEGPEVGDVEYGNDVEGSAFGGAGDPLGNSAWNLKDFGVREGSLLRHIGPGIPGVTSPMLYIGELFSTFSWHVEDQLLYSINYAHAGAPKVWYAVPAADANKLESAAATGAYAACDANWDLDKRRVRPGGQPAVTRRALAAAALAGKTTMLSPRGLLAAGVRVTRAVQLPGTFVVTLPRAYHAGFSTGFHLGEAVNFAPPCWWPYALASRSLHRVRRTPEAVPYERLLLERAKAVGLGAEGDASWTGTMDEEPWPEAAEARACSNNASEPAAEKNASHAISPTTLAERRVLATLLASLVAETGALVEALIVKHGLRGALVPAQAWLALAPRARCATCQQSFALACLARRMQPALCLACGYHLETERKTDPRRKVFNSAEVSLLIISRDDWEDAAKAAAPALQPWVDAVALHDDGGPVKCPPGGVGRKTERDETNAAGNMDGQLAVEDPVMTSDLPAATDRTHSSSAAVMTCPGTARQELSPENLPAGLPVSLGSLGLRQPELRAESTAQAVAAMARLREGSRLPFLDELEGNDAELARSFLIRSGLQADEIAQLMPNAPESSVAAKGAGSEGAAVKAKKPPGGAASNATVSDPATAPDATASGPAAARETAVPASGPASKAGASSEQPVSRRRGRPLGSHGRPWSDAEGKAAPRRTGRRPGGGKHAAPATEADGDCAPLAAKIRRCNCLTSAKTRIAASSPLGDLSDEAAVLAPVTALSANPATGMHISVQNASETDGQEKKGGKSARVSRQLKVSSLTARIKRAMMAEVGNVAGPSTHSPPPPPPDTEAAPPTTPQKSAPEPHACPTVSYVEPAASSGDGTAPSNILAAPRPQNPSCGAVSAPPAPVPVPITVAVPSMVLGFTAGRAHPLPALHVSDWADVQNPVLVLDDRSLSVANGADDEPTLRLLCTWPA